MSTRKKTNFAIETTKKEVPKAFYTVKELEERWCVCRATIYNYMKCGRLKRKLIGGLVRFEAAEIDRYERLAN